MTETLKVGTRGSELARTQAGTIRDALIAAGRAAELEIVTTPGDVNHSPVERIGVGVFTERLREALVNGECDVAVHSNKDLPTAEDERVFGVTPTRADPREALVARDGLTLETLPKGAKVGTSAPRRVGQLAALRPDLEIRPLRGNIDTRMGKVDSGELDAVILAYAGLTRVGRGDRATEVLDPRRFVPAPAQGALAVECRSDDEDTKELLRGLVDEGDAARVRAERAVLARLEAGCTAPVGALAVADPAGLRLRAVVAATDGSTRLVEELAGPPERAAEIGVALAEKLLDAGAAGIMAPAGD